MVWKITKFMLWTLYTLFFLYAFLHWAVLMLDEETNQFTVVLTDKFQGTSCEDSSPYRSFDLSTASAVYTLMYTG